MNNDKRYKQTHTVGNFSFRNKNKTVIERFYGGKCKRNFAHIIQIVSHIEESKRSIDDG